MSSAIIATGDRELDRYWDTWSPYWSYFEDSMLDVEGIQKLAIDLADPVLIVGAGQGLLVEQLLRKGFKADGVDLAPQMIKYAKERRNIDLIQADARSLPFPDGSYRTCIVATGVADFLEEERQVAAVVNEARRVTAVQGKTLLGFYSFHPKVERLMKYTGVITDDGYWRARRTYQLMSMRPREFLAALWTLPNVSVLGALSTFVAYQLFLPGKERRSTKTLNRLWKRIRKGGGAEAIIEATPELIPYRREPQIRSLFERLGQPIHQVYSYGSCTVVLLGPKRR